MSKYSYEFKLKVIKYVIGNVAKNLIFQTKHKFNNGFINTNYMDQKE